MSRPVLPTRARSRARVRGGIATLLSALLAVTTGAVLTGEAATGSASAASYPASASVQKKTTNPVTPGDFTGFGFDQCLTPTQAKMDAWLSNSPFLAVGIYISGTSRACRDQPNLTATWVTTQLTKGWRLLPITLGPQASCQPRFPRYDDDVTIDPRPGKNGRYFWANKMGKAEADSTVAAAKALGITAGSTLWYDLEGYDSANTQCRESALRFLSGWTVRIRELGYVSGVYSSAGSGIRDLDNARVNRPGFFTLPDRVWIARWDGVPNTATSYLRADGWLPGGRVKQYQGGHDETWGGVRINIDRNFLDVGRGSVAAAEKHCGSTRISYATYSTITPKNAPKGPVKALQCLLREKGVLKGPVTGTYGAKTQAAVRTWQARYGLPVSSWWTRKNWMTLLTNGPAVLLKFGSAGEAVRRLQRGLNAASTTNRLKVDGVFAASTDRALKAYQSKVGQTPSGVANGTTWQTILAGRMSR